MGEYTFEEVVKQVSLYLRYINNEKQLNAMISNNLKLESNPINRVLPLFIKDAAIGLSFLLTGEQTTSVLLTNLGVVKLPKDMEPFVDKFILWQVPVNLMVQDAVLQVLATVWLSLLQISMPNQILKENFSPLL